MPDDGLSGEIPRVNILGVAVAATDLAGASATIRGWIRDRRQSYVCVTGAHGIVESRSDPELRGILNGAGMVTADGMPLVWLSRAAGCRAERVYGPDLMLAVCRDADTARHFFYGGGDGVAARLASRLVSRFPGMTVAGTHTPPFRPLTPAEEDEIARQINAAAPDIVWVGLSTPRQEAWMARFRDRLDAPVLIGVGAAFDFHAGLKAQAPRWIRHGGLEWLFRLATEPRRLWRRYARIVPVFALLALGHLAAGRVKPVKSPDPGAGR